MNNEIDPRSYGNNWPIMTLQSQTNPRWKKVIARGIDSRNGHRYLFESSLLEISEDTSSDEKRLAILVRDVPKLKSEYPHIRLFNITETTEFLIPTEATI